MTISNPTIFGALSWDENVSPRGYLVAVSMTYGGAIDSCIDCFDTIQTETSGLANYPTNKSRKSKWSWIKKHAGGKIVKLKVELA